MPWRPLVDAVVARRRRAGGWPWGPQQRLVVPWLLLHLKAVLGVLGGGIAVLALVLIRRPWLVEAERQGLDLEPANARPAG